MRDIERELRALGERAHAETSRNEIAPPNMLRRIRTMRSLTAGAAMLMLFAVAGGGTLAARSFSTTPELRPAEDPVLDEQPTALFSSYLSQRIIITLLPAGETACYNGETLDGAVSRIELVDPDVDIGNVGEVVTDDVAEEIGAAEPVLVLLPQDGDSTVTRSGVSCVGGLDPELLKSIADDPANYGLAVSGARGRTILPLSRFEDLQAKSSCSDVTFEPTYLPKGWSKVLQEGSAVGADSENLLGHYGNEAEPSTDAKKADGFADLIVNDRPYGGPDEPELTVLGAPTELVRSDEAAYMSFGFDDCSYTLFMLLLPEQEFIRFAEGLRPKSDTPVEPEHGPGNFHAIWPEDGFQQAIDGCRGDASSRSDRTSVALEFANSVLGWDQAASFGGPQKSEPLEIRREAGDDGSEARGPAVYLYMTKVSSECWSVQSVAPLTEGDPQETGSMSVRGRSVSMRFDKRDAASVTHQVGYGGEATRYEWSAGDPLNVEFRLDFAPRRTGHFLLLYRDADGVVFSAQGSALPEGDFAAG